MGEIGEGPPSRRTFLKILFFLGSACGLSATCPWLLSEAGKLQDPHERSKIYEERTKDAVTINKFIDSAKKGPTQHPAGMVLIYNLDNGQMGQGSIFRSSDGRYHLFTIGHIGNAAQYAFIPGQDPIYVRVTNPRRYKRSDSSSDPNVVLDFDDQTEQLVGQMVQAGTLTPFEIVEPDQFLTQEQQVWVPSVLPNKDMVFEIGTANSADAQGLIQISSVGAESNQDNFLCKGSSGAPVCLKDTNMVVATVSEGEPGHTFERADVPMGRTCGNVALVKKAQSPTQLSRRALLGLSVLDRLKNMGNTKAI